VDDDVREVALIDANEGSDDCLMNGVNTEWLGIINAWHVEVR
jgi:hypothetical protein